MPSATTITLADATPANHVFSPRLKVGPELTILSNSGSQTSAGQWQIHLGFSGASANRPTNRVVFKLFVPYEHTVDGVVKVAHTARAIGEFVLPEEMTAIDRSHFISLFASLVANADFKGYIEDLDPYY